MPGVEQQPALYDGIVPPLNHLLLDRWRRQLFGDLAGDILELGLGTGLNLDAYGPGARITGLEINYDLIQAARPRATHRSVRLVQGDAEHLPFVDQSFDYVTSALVFCTIPDPAQALREVSRVLRPSGRMIQLEHTRTNQRLPDAVLDLIAPAWNLLAGGCYPNRDTAALLKATGWQLEYHERQAYGLIRLIVALPRRRDIKYMP